MSIFSILASNNPNIFLINIYGFGGRGHFWLGGMVYGFGYLILFTFYSLDSLQSVRDNEQCEFNSQNLYRLHLDSKVPVPAN